MSFCGDTDRPASIVRVLNVVDISDWEVDKDKLFSSGSEDLGRSLWLRRVPVPDSNGDLVVEDHRRLAKLMGDGLNVRIVEMLCIARRGVGGRSAGSTNLLSTLGLSWNGILMKKNRWDCAEPDLHLRRQNAGCSVTFCSDGVNRQE